MTSFPSKSACVFCSPCNTRSFGATPFARKSFSASETNCNGFCFVLCTAVSLIAFLFLPSHPISAPLRYLFLSLFSSSLLQPIRIKQDLPRQPFLQFRKRSLK